MVEEEQLKMSGKKEGGPRLVQLAADMRSSKWSPGGAGVASEIALPCIESERMLNALDQLLVRLQLVLQLPELWAGLVERLGHHIAEPLAAAAERFLRLRQQYRADATRLRESVPPLSSSSSEEAFDVTDPTAGQPPPPPLAPSAGLLATVGADEACVAALAATMEQLAAATRQLLRQWRLHGDTGTLQLSSELSGHFPPPTANFLEYMIRLRQQMYLRLSTTPYQEQSRTDRLREVWRRDLRSRAHLRQLDGRMERLLHERDTDRRVKNAVIDQLEREIATVELKAAEEVANVIAEADGDITAEHAAYQMERSRLLKVYDNNRAGLQKLRAANRASEAALKKRKYKIESELENWLQKYDAEMLAKLEEFETMQAEFEAETAEREDFEAKIEAMRDRYDSIVYKREEREEMRIMEEELMVKKEKAAVYIQAFWRGYRVRKRLKGKKGKKGKGKGKGGKGKGGKSKSKSPKATPKKGKKGKKK